MESNNKFLRAVEAVELASKSRIRITEENRVADESTVGEILMNVKASTDVGDNEITLLRTFSMNANVLKILRDLGYGMEITDNGYIRISW